MKNLLEVIQKILLLDLALLVPLLALMLILVRTAIGILTRLFKTVWQYVMILINNFFDILHMNVKKVVSTVLIIILICVFREHIVLLIEDYIQPTVPFVENSSDMRTNALVKELSTNVDSRELEIILDTIKSLQVQIGGQLPDYLSCMNLECGLDPWNISNGGKALSVLQFTATGMTETSYTMLDIKNAIYRRDIKLLMNAYAQYWRNQYKHRGSPQLNLQNMYMMLLCPRAVGKNIDYVLYDSGLEYSQNSGLDGWIVNEKGNIKKKTNMKDGKITVAECLLVLRFKENITIKKFFSNNKN